MIQWGGKVLEIRINKSVMLNLFKNGTGRPGRWVLSCPNHESNYRGQANPWDVVNTIDLQEDLAKTIRGRNMQKSQESFIIQTSAKRMIR